MRSEKPSFKFALGAMVKCRLTGYKGRVICRQEWLYGCLRYTLQAPKMLKNGEPVKPMGTDEGCLVLISEPEPEVIQAHADCLPARTGGPGDDVSRSPTASR